MSDLNKAQLIGRLGQDPQINHLPSGDAVANLSVATSERWKDKNTGEKKERTEWHRVAIFGKTAEIAARYLRKGSQVYIEGSLRTRKWQGQDGQDRYSTEIVVQGFGGTMTMLGSRNDAQGAADSQGYQRTADEPKTGYGASQAAQAPAQQKGADFDDDLPF